MYLLDESKTAVFDCDFIWYCDPLTLGGNLVI
jgi:hypothetical protein